MARNNDRHQSPHDTNSPEAQVDMVVQDRVQELTWALLDEQITDDEMELLDTLLLSDEKARHTYIGCVELHTDLLQRFAAPATQAGPKRGATSPILGFLNSGMQLGVETPPVEDTGP